MPSSCYESITGQLAARADDDELVVTLDRTWTAHACRERVGHLAAALAELGVRPGDRVTTLQDLSPDALFLWWALDRLGAVYMPLNPRWSTRLTARVLTDRAPTVLIAEEPHRPLAEAAARGTDVRVLAPPAGSTAPVPPAADRGALDDCCVVHNSGRPGIDHGVRGSWRLFAVQAGAMSANHPRDRVQVAGNPCFMGVLLTVYGAIAHGGSVAVLPRLTAATFWPTVRAAGVTYAALIDPAMADLLARPESPDDRDHPLRMVAASPAAHASNDAGRRRFGVRWLAGLGKTEVCGAVSTELDPGPEQGVGRVRPPFRGRVVDPAGADVPPGTPGELVLRCDVDGGLPVGYLDDPEATAGLWRAGWMHTGWHVRADDHGHLHPVGDLSVHPIVVKRAGYLFVADLEQEIVAVGEGVTAARVAVRPPATEVEDPVVVAWVTGDVEPGRLLDSLRAGLPAHLVPDAVVPVDVLPEQPDPLAVPV